MYDKLKAIATYCGEDFDPTDPSRILRVVRDFMRLFEKSLADIRVRQRRYTVLYSSPSWHTWRCTLAQWCSADLRLHRAPSQPRAMHAELSFIIMADQEMLRPAMWDWHWEQGLGLQRLKAEQNRSQPIVHRMPGDDGAREGREGS